MDSATIYHNPKCSTSRNTLALLRHAGLEPTVIEYLKNPPDHATLADLIQQAGLTVREAMREKEAIYTELGLNDPTLTDDQLLDAMVANPVLINRPIVVTQKGVRLCRPFESVFDVLPSIKKGPFLKENGAMVLDEQGRRV